MFFFYYIFPSKSHSAKIPLFYTSQLQYLNLKVFDDVEDLIIFSKEISGPEVDRISYSECRCDPKKKPTFSALKAKLKFLGQYFTNVE